MDLCTPPDPCPHKGTCQRAVHPPVVLVTPPPRLVLWRGGVCVNIKEIKA